MKKHINDIPLSVESRSVREDYLHADPALRSFYRLTPRDYDVRKMVTERQKQDVARKVLADTLTKQYRNLPEIKAVNDNINRLRNENCFTLTTGHQPILFGGPLYVIYKALTVIRLAESFKSQMPEADFVPVFWVASEDHDAQELNHTWIGFKDKKIYESPIPAAVGRHLLTDEIKRLCPDDKLLLDCWQPGNHWADAFIATLHGWLGKLGLVILNPDEPELKRSFLAVAQKEFTDRPTEPLILATNMELETKGYSLQLNPRPVNLFYLTDEVRGRIIPLPSGDFKIDHTDLHFTKKHLIDHVCRHPELVSPNAALRPLFQETILPNLVYVGGWGEIAYWMQLGAVFEYYQVPMPLIMPRASALIWTESQWKEWQTFGLEVADIFLPDAHFRKQALQQLWDETPLQEWSDELTALFTKLNDYVGTLTPQQQHNVKGQLVKNQKFTAQLRKKMAKMILRQHPLTYQPILRLKDRINPEGAVQERLLNPASFMEYGYSSQEVVDQLCAKIQTSDWDLQHLILSR